MKNSTLSQLLKKLDEDSNAEITKMDSFLAVTINAEIAKNVKGGSRYPVPNNACSNLTNSSCNNTVCTGNMNGTCTNTTCGPSTNSSC